MTTLLESGEMYLETILILSQNNPKVRSVDVSKSMNFSKPSVSRAVGLLKDSGHITIDENGLIELTEEGKSVAEKIYERHTLLTKYFVDLGVSYETAQADACKIEHVISDESFNAIKRQTEKG